MKILAVCKVNFSHPFLVYFPLEWLSTHKNYNENYLYLFFYQFCYLTVTIILTEIKLCHLKLKATKKHFILFTKCFTINTWFCLQNHVRGSKSNVSGSFTQPYIRLPLDSYIQCTSVLKQHWILRCIVTKRIRIFPNICFISTEETYFNIFQYLHLSYMLCVPHSFIHMMASFSLPLLYSLVEHRCVQSYHRRWRVPQWAVP